MTLNGRQDKRQPVALKIRFRSATLNDFIEKNSADISYGGIFIKMTTPMQVGTLIKFDLRLEDESELIQGVGRVVWRREKDEGEDSPSGMGIKFIKLDEKSKSNLDEIIVSKAKGKERKEPSKPAEEEKQVVEDKSKPIPPSKPQQLRETAQASQETAPAAAEEGLEDRIRADSHVEKNLLADISSAINTALGDAGAETHEKMAADSWPGADEAAQAADKSEQEAAGGDITADGKAVAAGSESVSSDSDSFARDSLPPVVAARVGVKPDERRSMPALAWIAVAAVLVCGAIWYFAIQSKSGKASVEQPENALTSQAPSKTESDSRIPAQVQAPATVPEPLPPQKTITSIAVNTKPTGAKVLVDGNAQPGVTPMNVENLTVGKEIAIEFRMFGYLPSVEKVVPSEKPISVDVELKEAKLALEFASEPADAEIFINGELFGKTPASVSKRELGPQVAYRIKKNGYEDATGTVTENDWIEKDGVYAASVNVQLKKIEQLPQLESQKKPRPQAKQKKEEQKPAEAVKPEPKPAEAATPEPPKKEKTAIEENPF